MLRIGIELNGVLRNVNYQMCKYYAKDINSEFTFDKIDIDNMNPAETLKFPSKKKFNEFVYIDYPYEIFGCATSMQRGLEARFTEWLEKLPDDEREEFDVGVFGLDEEALTIQSSYFFLSKFGCRTRHVSFPKSAEDAWNEFDVIVTCNPDIIRSMPKGKKFVMIERNNNKRYAKKAAAVYKTAKEAFEDPGLVDKILDAGTGKKETFINKIIRKITNR